MPLLLHWSALPFDERRSLVYSPAWGRAYVLTAAQCADPALQRWLGLSVQNRLETLPDPADSVLRVGSVESSATDTFTPPPSRRDVALYRFLDRTRSLLPFGWMARRVARRATTRSAPLHVDADAIGALVQRVERAAGLGDCYPRALFTAHLCARAGLPFRLVIGALVPTRMLHAWCCVDGRVPYEPTPQHWIYQPAILLDNAG
jgi:hypothetical protein